MIMFHIMTLVAALFFTMSLFNHVSTENEFAYQASIVNTALHRSSIFTHPLTTIPLKSSSIKMVAFTTYDGYKVSSTTSGADIWVTVAPELQRLCRDYVKENQSRVTHQQLTLWITQLLGLAANNADKRRFVEMRVPVIQTYYGASSKKIGIFRPCTDPRIRPHRDGSPICPKQMDPNDKNILSAYKTWFINNHISSHVLNNGVPWTEYGYTYNWNKQARSIVGASEFIVRKDTPVVILPNPKEAATPYISPEQYCQ
jgi:hypothetical protein